MLKNIGLALLAAGTIAAGTVAVDSSARADGGVTAGVLTCNVSGGIGFIFGSSRDMSCIYSTTGERYVGEINKYGVDIGFTKGAVMQWAVVAPTGDIAPGTLAGHYGGATAGATVAVGVAANALIGGNSNTIQLQPLSIEGNRGLNVAAGIAEVTLRPAR